MCKNNANIELECIANDHGRCVAPGHGNGRYVIKAKTGMCKMGGRLKRMAKTCPLCMDNELLPGTALVLNPLLVSLIAENPAIVCFAEVDNKSLVCPECGESFGSTKFNGQQTPIFVSPSKANKQLTELAEAPAEEGSASAQDRAADVIAKIQAGSEVDWRKPSYDTGEPINFCVCDFSHTGGPDDMIGIRRPNSFQVFPVCPECARLAHEAGCEFEDAVFGSLLRKVMVEKRAHDRGEVDLVYGGVVDLHGPPVLSVTTEKVEEPEQEDGATENPDGDGEIDDDDLDSMGPEPGQETEPPKPLDLSSPADMIRAIIRGTKVGHHRKREQNGLILNGCIVQHCNNEGAADDMQGIFRENPASGKKAAFAICTTCAGLARAELTEQELESFPRKTFDHALNVDVFGHQPRESGGQQRQTRRPHHGQQSNRGQLSRMVAAMQNQSGNSSFETHGFGDAPVPQHEQQPKKRGSAARRKGPPENKNGKNKKQPTKRQPRAIDKSLQEQIEWAEIFVEDAENSLANHRRALGEARLMEDPDLISEFEKSTAEAQVELHERQAELDQLRQQAGITDDEPDNGDRQAANG